jgi:FtsP/CotA-like multicopper oxidase with cupredoxin domain
MSALTTIPRKRRLQVGLVALLAGLLAVLLPAAGSPPAVAQTVNQGIVCTDGPTFDLETDDGFISVPDGNSVYMWSYKAEGTSFQLPGPVLCVEEGDTVTVNLTNNLAEPVSIVFPGQTDVTATGGSSGLLTSEAPAGGGTVSYSFVADEPGTYLYESGTEPSKQVQMGLYGALIVRPSIDTATAKYAYGDVSTRYDPEREYLLVLHEIDPVLHNRVRQGRPYDVTQQHMRYWTVNGRAFPDPIADNDVPWLPSQPYGGLVTVEARDPSSPGLPALVRYANAGMFNHPFHPHGNHLRTIARDGRLLGDPGGASDASMESFTRTIGSGQTADLLFSWLDVDPWASSGGDPVPVTIPSLQNLVFADDATFYSGDPQLGNQDELPTRVTSFNECGEFYFPWHSHALFEFQNFNEGFGGLATLARVDPPGGCS